jgi:DNA-binding MarR family transcriptional regulator
MKGGGDEECGDEECGDEESGKRKRAEGRATGSGKLQWREAERWRRRVEGALVGSGLTFRQWLVLDAIRFLVEKTGDAVNQNQIAAYVELDRRAISDVMGPLERKWLVSRGPPMSGWAWRVFLTEEAEVLLGDHEEAIEFASAADSQEALWER